jgi:hypothetical protein
LRDRVLRTARVLLALRAVVLALRLRRAGRETLRAVLRLGTLTRFFPALLCALTRRLRWRCGGPKASGSGWRNMDISSPPDRTGKSKDEPVPAAAGGSGDRHSLLCGRVYMKVGCGGGVGSRGVALRDGAPKTNAGPGDCRSGTGVGSRDGTGNTNAGAGGVRARGVLLRDRAV